MPPKGKGKGKGKGKKKENSKKPKNRAPTEPTSNDYDMAFSNILSRLSVKTLLRFKCVCKQWRSIISKSKFIATHFSHSSALQRIDSSVFLHTLRNEPFGHILSLYKHPAESTVELDSPYPSYFKDMAIMGPLNGIFCLFRPPAGDVLTLWNPAMRKSKMVRLSKTKPPIKVPYFVSVGMAFDYQNNDFLVLRIFCVGKVGNGFNQVEMHSMKRTFGWRTLKAHTNFEIIRYTCGAIVKGVPYWFANVNDSLTGEHEGLVCFDVGKAEFRTLRLPVFREEYRRQYLTNYEDSLALLNWEDHNGGFIDVWVIKWDDEIADWSLKRTIGPFLGFKKILSRLWNGHVVAVTHNDNLITLDPVARKFKVHLKEYDPENESYVVFDYPESLFLVEGMQSFEKQDAPVELDLNKIASDLDDYIQQHSGVTVLVGPP